MSHITRLLLCLVFVAPVIACQKTSSWIGQKVVPKYGYSIKIGDQVYPFMRWRR